MKYERELSLVKRGTALPSMVSHQSFKPPRFFKLSLITLLSVPANNCWRLFRRRHKSRFGPLYQRRLQSRDVRKQEIRDKPLRL